MNRPESGTRRSLLSRSAFVFGIRAIPALAVILIAIWFARRLPANVNGAYQQVWINLAVFVAIGSAGIPALLITHDQQQLHRWMRRLQGRQVFLFFLGNMALATILWLSLRDSPLPPALIAGLYLAQLMALVTETYLVISDRFKTLLGIILVYTAAFVTLHWAFLEDRITCQTLFLGISALLAARALLQLGIGFGYYIKHRSRLREAGMSKAIRRQWLQLGIYDVSQLVFRYIDKLLIGWIIGPAGLAVYYYGTMDIPIMPLLLGAAGTAILRQLATTQTGVEAKISMMHFTGTTLARIVFPLFAFFFLFRTEIITVLFGEKYAAAIPLFAISALAIPLRAYNFTAILQHLNQVRIINTGALLDLLLALALAYPLYLWKGLQGVAFSFTICSYFQALFYLYHTSKILKRPIRDLIPLTDWTILLAIYLAVIVAIRSAFKDMGSMRSQLLLGAGMTVVIIAGSLYPVFFSRKKQA